MKKTTTKKPQTINITHNYPAIPPVNERAIEVVGSLSSALCANAEAIKENAMALGKIAEMASELGHSSLSIEASALTAKNGACMDVRETAINMAPGEYRNSVINPQK
jgi:hypothetical protein